MGCCGRREKGFTVTEEQKWDYITLSDFESRSCLAIFSYIWLWILVLISVAVYAADAFTAVNLLAFNKWSSQVKPKVSFDVAKWIFAICIIVSYVFLLYRWIRAIQVVRSGSVSESYLEPLAAIIQSMRITKSGQGWKRFLVFAELTRSRKGVDYIALFVYFQFKGALLIIVAQGPRMAINGLTLWAVMQAQLIPIGDHASKDRSAFLQFFVNIETLVNTGNKQETIIYFTMLFSLFIWAIAALSLIASAIFYVFLWHYIPSSDGKLSKYCRRKIDSRLERIVGKTIKKALEKQNLKRKQEEQQAIKEGKLDGPAARIPTLPKFGGKDDDASSVYSMSRSDTMSTTATLPPYSSIDPSRTSTMSTNRTLVTKPSLPSVDERPYPSRTNTGASAYSNMSYGSDAPIMSQGASMGRSSPAPPMPALDRNAEYFNGPQGGRPMAPGMAPGARPYSPMAQGRASPRPPRNVLPPVNTNYDNGRMSPSPQLVSPLPNDPRGLTSPQGNNPYPRRFGPSPLTDPTFSPYDNRAPRMGPAYEMSPVDMTPSEVGSNYSQQSYAPNNNANDFRPPQLPSVLRSGSPAQSQPPSMINNFSQQPPRAGTAPPLNGRPGIPASLQSAIQRREASQPNMGMNRGVAPAFPQQRSATAPIRQPGWGQGAPRSNTADPERGYDNSYGNGNGNGYGQSRGSDNGW